MNKELIEAVARALCKVDCDENNHSGGIDCGGCPGDNWKRYDDVAEAAITAHLKHLEDNITEKMKHDGGEVLYGNPRSSAVEWAKEDKFDCDAETAVEVFRAMINASKE